MNRLLRYLPNMWIFEVSYVVAVAAVVSARNNAIDDNDIN